MPNLTLSRRRVLGAAGSFAVWLAASPAELLAASRDDRPAAPYDGAPAYRVLTVEQAAALDAFAAQVIASQPRSPIACKANVTRFADNGLAGFAREQRADFASAVEALDAEAVRLVPGTIGFASLAPAQQADVMRSMDKSNHGAFETLRAPVITGMFANPGHGGALRSVRWRRIGFDDRFYWRPPLGF